MRAEFDAFANRRQEVAIPREKRDLADSLTPRQPYASSADSIIHIELTTAFQLPNSKASTRRRPPLLCGGRDAISGPVK